MMTKKNQASRLLSLLLLLTLGASALLPVAAQEPQRRERRVNPTAAPVPTPAPTPLPTPQPAPAPVTPVTPAPGTGSALQTVEELRARIQEVMHRPELAPIQFAVKVSSLDTGRTIYEENAGKLLMPASNMKIYTIAAALDRLSPDYRFTTSVYAQARPDAAGTIRGDLTVYGRGDPSFAAGFYNGDYYRAIDDLAARIAAAGVRRVEGDLVGDESYFSGPVLGIGWEWDDLQTADAAEVSALSVNNNAVDLLVRPGPGVGTACAVTTGPPTPLVTIVNRTTTTAPGTKRDIRLRRALGGNVVEVTGSLPLDDRTDKGYAGSIAITNPALLFVYMLRTSLAQKGVTISGRSRTVDATTPGAISYRPAQTDAALIRSTPSQTPAIEIASRQSPPLSEIAAQTLKPSQNLYTELILRAVGQAAPTNTDGPDPGRTSVEAGVLAVKAFLRQAGVDPGSLIMADGSGLSRHNYITAAGTLQLLAYMSRHRYANAFRSALPVAGVDGTLRTRMRGTPAAGNVRAKTGTISDVATLSGYVTSAGGERLAFSILVNNYPEGSNVRRSYIDTIAVMLASFAGRS